MSEVVIVTDPAFEIAKLISLLAQFDPTDANERSWAAIKRAIGKNIQTYEYAELVSTLLLRLRRLGEFVSNVRDIEFSERMRVRVGHAIGRFSALFEPEQQYGTWQNTRVAHATSDDALQLEFFSVIAKRYRPLRKLVDEDRVKLITQIEEAQKALSENSDVPDWAKGPLSDGLERLKLTLKFLTFFGCEAAIDALSRLSYDSKEIENRLPITSLEGSPRSKTISDILLIVVTLRQLILST